ncbi:serine/threonine-protein kinase [Kitasatospora sp. NPDC004799]|uniref:serine/threonine-protein kinase n=1 Tax=Kitasatospora sp. NPDC004799 TaxID=3154460 RepID=UPI00339EAFBC
MGVVYKADDLKTGQQVAIKFLQLRDDRTGSGVRQPAREDRGRFSRECRLHQQFGGQGVPRLVHQHLTGLRWYFVTEYVDGLDLRKFLERNRPGLPAVASVIVPLLEVLDRIHSEHVIHRDVKPPNILLEHESGRLYLTDFGIALPLAPEATRYTKDYTPGTFGYMAPELHRGERNPTGAADLYGVGCIGFRMISGEPVFTGDDVELMRRHREERPPLLSALVPGLSVPIVEITDGLLAKDPRDRPTVSEALAVWRAHLPLPSDPAPQPTLSPDPTLPYRQDDGGSVTAEPAARTASGHRPRVQRPPVGGLTRSGLRALLVAAGHEVASGAPDHFVHELGLLLPKADRRWPGDLMVTDAHLLVARAHVVRGEEVAARQAYRSIEHRLADGPLDREHRERLASARFGALCAEVATGASGATLAPRWLAEAETLLAVTDGQPGPPCAELCMEAGLDIRELLEGEPTDPESARLRPEVTNLLDRLPGQN